MKKIIFAMLLIALVIATTGCGKGGAPEPETPDVPDTPDDSDLGDEGIDDFGEDLDSLDDLGDIEEPDIDPEDLDLS